MNIKSSKSSVMTIYTFTLIMMVLAAYRLAALGPTCDAGSSTKYPSYGMGPYGCTVITISKGDSVFFGGNDDYINPDSYYWVEPGGRTYCPGSCQCVGRCPSGGSCKLDD